MATLLERRQQSTAEKILVMQAYIDGKIIVMRLKETNGEWREIRYPSWDWVNYEYKVQE